MLELAQRRRWPGPSGRTSTSRATRGPPASSLVPVVLEQTAAVVRDDAPARDDALARDWPAPDFGVDKHRIYMMQWYAFAATAAGLVALLHAAPAAMSGTASPSGTGMSRRNRRTLILLALVTVAPVIASYAAYYWFPRDKQANYGELLPTRPAPELAGVTPGGAPFRLSELRGRWVLAVAAPGACDRACTQALYATRQARTIQGREMERVARLLLVTGDGAPPAALAAEHPDLVTARVPAGALARVARRRRPHLPRRPARQPRARVSARPRHQGDGEGPHAPAQGVADWLGRAGSTV